MIINGIPTVNFTCFVLCLNRYIPIYIPIPPRIKAIKKSVFSLTLYWLLIAFALSYFIKKIANKFIIKKYITIANALAIT